MSALVLSGLNIFDSRTDFRSDPLEADQEFAKISHYETFLCLPCVSKGLAITAEELSNEMNRKKTNTESCRKHDLRSFVRVLIFHLQRRWRVQS